MPLTRPLSQSLTRPLSRPLSGGGSDTPSKPVYTISGLTGSPYFSNDDGTGFLEFLTVEDSGANGVEGDFSGLAAVFTGGSGAAVAYINVDAGVVTVIYNFLSASPTPPTSVTLDGDVVFPTFIIRFANIVVESLKPVFSVVTVEDHNFPPADTGSITFNLDAAPSITEGSPAGDFSGLNATFESSSTTAILNATASSDGHLTLYVGYGVGDQPAGATLDGDVVFPNFIVRFAFFSFGF